MENHSLNKVGGLLAASVSADEAVCAMKQLNEVAKTVGPYSEDELQLRGINGKREKYGNVSCFYNCDVHLWHYVGNKCCQRT